MSSRKTAFVLALATLSLSAFAAPTPSQTSSQRVGVRKVTETTWFRQADGATIAKTRRVKDLAGYFRGLGFTVVSGPNATQDDCLGIVYVTAPSTGGGGAGGSGPPPKPKSPPGKQPPPDVDAAVAAQMLPPVYVTSSDATTYTEGTTFADGWSVEITWARNPGPPAGTWTITNLNWTPPSNGPQDDGDCGDDGEEG